MMIGRRTLLSRIVGAAALAPSISVHDVLAASKAIPKPNFDDFPEPSTSCGPPDTPLHRHIRDAISRAYKEADLQRSVATGHIPYDIAGKRSWSPAFKHHVVRERNAELLALERLRYNDEALSNILAKLGLE